MWYSRKMDLLVPNLVFSLLLQVSSESCPAFCQCFNETASCEKIKHLNYIPKFPSKVRYLTFIGATLPIINIPILSNLTNLKLEVLKLQYSSIQIITPNALSHLRYIKELDLSGNRNMTVENVINAVTGICSNGLTSLILNDLLWKNESYELYNALFRLKLKKLSMNRNSLKFLNFTHINKTLPLIERLEVSLNWIEKIETHFLINLEHLDLSYNFFQLNDTFFGENENRCFFPKLTYLDLQSNNIISYQNCFHCLEQLRHLTLSKNPAKRIYNDSFVQLHSLKVLRIMDSGTRIYSIQPLAFKSNSLEVLDFSGNNFDFASSGSVGVDFFPNEIFKYLPNLRIINLSRNIFCLRTNYLQTMLLHLSNLTKLIVRHCNLPSLPKHIFYKLPKLKIIDFSFNDIKRWNGLEVFRDTTSIRHINLSSNYISAFVEDWFPRLLQSSIREVDLSGNPFSCCCKNLWFRKWVSKNPQMFKNYPEKYVCETPVELEGKLLKDYFPSGSQCANINILLVTFTTLCIIGIFFTIFASILYKARWHIRHAIYLYRVKRKGYEQLESNENFQYSGFVVYSEKDATWVHKKLIKMVENDRRKLCIHQRDFEVGKVIVDNIVDNIARSKKVVLILSRAMMKSEWCLFEIKLAHKRFLKRDDSLLIIMLEQIPLYEMPNSLHNLLTVSTYLSWSNETLVEDNFWEKVRKFLN